MCKKCERFGIAGIVDTRTVPDVKYFNFFFVWGVDFFGEKKRSSKTTLGVRLFMSLDTSEKWRGRKKKWENEGKERMKKRLNSRYFWLKCSTSTAIFKVARLGLCI